jgi:hypothetical protein
MVIGVIGVHARADGRQELVLVLLLLVEEIVVQGILLDLALLRNLAVLVRMRLVLVTIAPGVTVLNQPALIVLTVTLHADTI